MNVVSRPWYAQGLRLGDRRNSLSGTGDVWGGGEGEGEDGTRVSSALTGWVLRGVSLKS